MVDEPSAERARLPPSNLGALGEGKGILDLDAEVTDRRLDLRVPEQDLHGSQVACLLVDDRGLRPPQRMRTVAFRPQTDGGDPLVHEAYWRVLI